MVVPHLFQIIHKYTPTKVKRQVFFILQNKFAFYLTMRHNSRCLGMIMISVEYRYQELTFVVSRSSQSLLLFEQVY